MSDQGENINSQVTLQFSGVDFDVEICDENGVLEINVENCDTSDHWTGKYDASCKSSILLFFFIFQGHFLFYLNFILFS